MGYEKTTIKKIIAQIVNGQVFLPAIQRKFVWDVEQIEKLFDSLLLKYPIGTFLFWKIDNSVVNNYVFYKFIQEYHERDSVNEVAPKPVFDSIIGILDGQQRLTALFIALQGSYAYKKSYARWDNDDAFPKRRLYFNLLKNEIDSETGITYEFKFYPISDLPSNDSEHFWFSVKEALKWNNSSDYVPFAQQNGLLENVTALQNLQLLWQCLVNDDVINYYEVENQELDEILDIFIRVNSGGTPLSKSDLLFSTIVANWEDARERIDDLVKSLNRTGDGFTFNTDFIMRLCLMVLDYPIKFKVSSFSKNNVDNIKANWSSIESSVKNIVSLLAEFGLCSETMTTNNIVLPLCYYIYHGGTLVGKSKGNIWKYLVYGMLKQVFGSSGDSVLSVIRDVVRKQIDIKKQAGETIEFEFAPIEEMRIGNEAKFKFDIEDIDNLLDAKKGPYTFLVLSLLCPNICTQTVFHQDHIHPAASFNTKLKKDLNLSDKDWDILNSQKDTLPNLQLLEGRQNCSKRDTLFSVWFKHDIVSKGDEYRDKYMRLHFIPSVFYDISEFGCFYKERRKLLREALCKIFL